MANRESPEEYRFRRSVLKQFRCPWMDDGVCSRHANQCMFGHPDGHSQLRDFPHYVCVHHMINRCSNTRPGDNGEAVQMCPVGFHLSIEEMDNIEAFEVRNAKRIVDFFGDDLTRQCGICQERVLSKHLARNRRFALLSNCSCCFCATCIQAFRSSSAGADSSLKCPLCSVVSSQVHYRANFVENREEKRRLFNFLNHNSRVAYRSNQ